MAVSLVAGCTGAKDHGSPRSAVDVAEDEHATAAEIVAAGYPFDADSNTEGSRLIAYRVIGEASDVEQTAWKLYRADGDAIAAGKGVTTVIGVGDEFWIGDRVIGSDGKEESPARSEEPLSPQSGDVPVSGFETIEAVRPVPLTAYSPRPTPRGFGQGWTLDDQGRQWYQQVEPDKVLTSGGPQWEQVRDVPSGARHLLGFGITPVGTHIVLPLVVSTKGETIHVDAIALRRADADATAAWTILPAGPLAKGTRDASPRTFAVDDRYYVFSDFRGAPYALDVTTRRWSRVTLPTDESYWALEPGRGGIYAFPPVTDDGPVPDTWFSPDLGRTWTELRH